MANLTHPTETPKYEVTAYQFHGPKGHIFYKENGEPCQSVISTEDFHQYLKDQGIGAARTFLNYLTSAPSWQYVARDIARYMEYKEQSALMFEYIESPKGDNVYDHHDLDECYSQY